MRGLAARPRRLIAVAFVLACTAALPATADAVELTVDTTVDTRDDDPGDGICADFDGACSLRAAVDETNAQVDGPDTIVVPAGTYKLVGFPYDEFNEEGDLNVTYEAGPLTVKGAGPGETIVEGSGRDRVWGIFDDFYEGQVTLEGMTITGGRRVPWGGGVLAYTPLVMRDVDVVGNSVRSAEQSVQGGGLFAAAVVTLVRVRFLNNTATSLEPVFPTATGGEASTSGFSTQQYGVYTAQGGGLFTHSEADLTEVVISGNSAISESADYSGPQGGGYAALGPVVIRRSLISGNEAKVPHFLGYAQGGGLISISSAWLSDTTVDGNRLIGPEPNEEQAEVETWASQGAGIFSLFSLWTDNVTITGNSIVDPHLLGGAPEGAAVLQLDKWTSASTIVGDNLVNGTQSNCAYWVAPPISRGGNLDQGSSCGFFHPTDMIDTDPLLGPLADNGGFSHTRALLEGSPALDAGSSDVCPGLDQRRIPRPQGPACDSGAYETVVPVEEQPEDPPAKVVEKVVQQPAVAGAVAPAASLVLTATNGRGVRTTFPCTGKVPFRMRSKVCRKVTVRPPSRSGIKVLWGKRARVVGFLRRQLGGAPVAGRKIDVAVRSFSSSRWRRQGQIVTGRHGRWNHLLKAGRSRVVRFSTADANPIEVELRVRAGASLSVSRHFVEPGAKLRFRGRAHALPRSTPVQLQARRLGGSWRTIEASWTRGGGRFAMKSKALPGRVYYRALVVPPPPTSLDSGWSRKPTVVNAR